MKHNAAMLWDPTWKSSQPIIAYHQSLAHIIHSIKILKTSTDISLDPLKDETLELKMLIETEKEIINTQHNVVSSIVALVQYMQRTMKLWEGRDGGRAGVVFTCAKRMGSSGQTEDGICSPQDLTLN